MGKEKRKAGVQQLWIIDMGQEGDITRQFYKEISSCISIHTEAQSAVAISHMWTEKIRSTAATSVQTLWIQTTSEQRQKHIYHKK